jgi:hypothetical protein
MLRAEISDYAEEEGFSWVVEGNSESISGGSGARVGAPDSEPQVPTPEPGKADRPADSILTGRRGEV